MNGESNQTAKDLFLFYKKQYDGLVNTYCQCKQNHPFEVYTQLSKAIWRVSRVMEVWHGVAVSNATRRYYEGG